MATTVISEDFTVKHYSRTTLMEAADDTFFARNGMIGGRDDVNAIVNEVTELQKEPGDTVHYNFLSKLTNRGVRGDTDLEGNEAQLRYFRDTVTIDMLRNAVRLPGRMGRRKNRLQGRQDGRTVLKLWQTEVMEEVALNHLVGNTAETFPSVALAPSTGRHLFAGTATAESDLTNSSVHKLTIEEIFRLDEKARTVTPKLRPIRTNEFGNVYVLLIHPFQASHLKIGGTSEISKAWREYQKYAKERGNKNPLFSGALGMINNTVIHEVEGLPLFSTGSGGVQVARAVLLGAQALTIAFGGDPFWNEKDFDYGNSPGVAFGATWGVKKTRFNGNDHGVITLSTTAVALAGTAHS